jgi:nucleotide-binding universal stress UspA family protein
VLKDLLVNVSLDAERDSTGEYAISVAKSFGAHITATACAFSPVYPTTTPMELLGTDFIGAARATNRHLAEASVARFRQLAAKAGVEAETRIVEATVADAAKSLAKAARCTDIAVVSQAEPKEWDSEQVVETVLFGSGRPVLVVPYIQRAAMSLNCVVLCWDGSRAAARAIGDAMPLLRRAESIHLVTVIDDHTKSDKGDAEMGRHLARHGIDAKQRHLHAEAGEEANAILNHVSDSGADLVVMGGYGHARLLEFVLGGVTRGMLGSMTVPVLLSH